MGDFESYLNSGTDTHRMHGSQGMEVFSPKSPTYEDVDSCTVVHTPQLRNDFIPRIGQEFVTLDGVQEFYNNYARECGFSMRIHSSKKDRACEIIRKEYVCSKEGVSLSKNKINIVGPIVRKRGMTREGCGAKLTVVKIRSGTGFVVTQFIEDHSHSLTTPRRVHLLRSHRHVSIAKKALTSQLALANVPISQRMSIFEVQSGGLQNIGFLERDLRNAERDKRKMLAGHDANMLYEHFLSQQENNPSFATSFLQDDEGCLTHCFWADATCRKSYQYFGDVVVFDTTYNTNRYGMIFAPLIGVNHHGQTTLFGCAFLSDEKVDSFDWLLTEWLKAMPGGPPKMIITDQDPAMARSIGNVLPRTQLLEGVLLSTQKKFSVKNSGSAEGGENSFQMAFSLGSEYNFKEPLPVRAKGCGKRLKGGKEKAVKKSRRCNGCGLTGQSHDKRNCPKLMNRSSQHFSPNDDDDDDEDDDDHTDDEINC